jgi:hypothetical protein
MKNYKFLMLSIFASLLVMSCDDGFDTTYSSLDTPAKGAVADYSNVVGGFYNLLDKDNTSISFDLTTIGDAVNSIEIFKAFNGGDKVSHGMATPGSTVTISLVDGISGLNANIDDLVPGDNITYSFASNTNSGTFQSGSALVINASCPSDIGGEYTANTTGQSTDGCCPNPVTIETDVTLTDNGGGSYTLSDFSCGLYFAWYEVYGISELMQTDGTLSIPIIDVCNELTGTVGEPFGTPVNLAGSLDPATGEITFSWTNGYDDGGTTTLTPK